MSSAIPAKSAAERGLGLIAELDDVAARNAGARSTWPIGQRERAERLETAIRTAATESEAECETAARAVVVATAERANWARAKEAMKDPRNLENGFGGGADIYARERVSRSPWDNLPENVSRSDSLAGLTQRAHDAIERLDDSVPSHAREVLAGMLALDRNSDSAAYVIAASDPHYVAAFLKGVASEHGHRSWTADEQRAYSRVEQVRASLSLTGANGGYVVPIPLDPGVVLTNSGVVNPIREIARIETTASATWTGASSAGTTGTWTSENAALTDSSPTFSAITVTPNKLTAWISGSYEIFQDSNIAAQLPMLIGEAFARAEGAAFITGSGSAPTPLGVVTAVATVAASTVTATTRGSFTTASVGDLFALDNALPARARAGRPAWIANRTTLNTIRAMSAAAAGSSFWATLGEKTPSLLLGSPVYEASAMTAATTSGSSLIILGDFTDYLIVDRIGTVVEYVANVVDGNGVPTGTRGWIAHKRTGATLTNGDGFRRLLT